MITPDSIRDKTFQASRRGYDRQEVDEYLRRVAHVLQLALQGIVAQQPAPPTLPSHEDETGVVSEMTVPGSEPAPSVPAPPAYVEADQSSLRLNGTDFLHLMSFLAAVDARATGVEPDNAFPPPGMSIVLDDDSLRSLERVVDYLRHSRPKEQMT